MTLNAVAQYTSSPNKTTNSLDIRPLQGTTRRGQRHLRILAFPMVVDVVMFLARTSDHRHSGRESAEDRESALHVRSRGRGAKHITCDVEEVYI